MVCLSYLFSYEIDVGFQLIICSCKISIDVYAGKVRFSINKCCDCVQQVNGSLLPAGVIAAYCTYLSYSALSSEPRDYECNGLHKHVNAVSKGTLGLGMLTTLLSVVYSAVRAGSSTTFLSPPSSPRDGILFSPFTVIVSVVFSFWPYQFL